MIYFDNAATSPLRPEVIAEMHRVMQEDYGNPSSTHAPGRKAKTIIEDARRQIAQLLGAKPGEIIFTSGGSESDNWALRKSVEAKGIQNIITSAIEHHAITHTAEELEARGLVKIHWIKHQPNGHIDMDHLEQLLSAHDHALVSLMHANNELGNLNNISEIGEMCFAHQALFHSDTVQTIGHFPINFSQTKIHYASAAAHKFNGPKGIGFIFMREGYALPSFMTGGSQERGVRGGTENVYGIAGMAKALTLACANMEKDRTYVLSLKNAMIAGLKEAIPGVSFNGDTEGNSNYSVLNVHFPEHPVSEMLLFKLDIEGICCSGGSACNSGSNMGSHVLSHLGISQSSANVRFSFGHQNSLSEIEKVIQTLKDIYIGVAQSVS